MQAMSFKPTVRIKTFPIRNETDLATTEKIDANKLYANITSSVIKIKKIKTGEWVRQFINFIKARV